MSREIFGRLRQMLMEQLDLSRELSDKEILDVIDELILNQTEGMRLALKEKVRLRQELFYSCLLYTSEIYRRILGKK